MHQAFSEGVKSREAGLDVPTSSVFGRGDVLREPIFHGGESAYSFQFLDFALQRYGPDDDWLRTVEGFGIADAHAVVHAAGRLPAAKLMTLLERARRDGQTAPDVLPGFVLSLEEIAKEAGVAADVARTVLDAFTAPGEPANEGFRSLGDFNLAAACPLLRTPSGDYVSLQSYGLYEALYDSPFYWMQADPAYRAVSAKNRGDFTERFVATRLAAVFGSTRVHRGVAIKRGAKHVTDVDVLVMFADRALVVQCKSKKLTLAARKGNNLQLRSNFGKAVQDAYEQAKISAEGLADPLLTFLDANGSPIKIPSLRAVYPVCIVSEAYPALAVQARMFLKRSTDGSLREPLVADVFLLDVMAEMLASPLRLLSYVDRRVSYGGRLNSANEHAILGFHLSSNLWIGDDYTMAMIDDRCATDLDAAMTVRREGVPGSRTPSGVLTKLNETPVGRYLAAIETREDPAETGLGFFLLTLWGDAVADLGEALRALAARTRADGRPHDMTHGFGQARPGLTVHCSPSFSADTVLAPPSLRKKEIHPPGGRVVRSARAS